jgi:hypothetical protein
MEELRSSLISLVEGLSELTSLASGQFGGSGPPQPRSHKALGTFGKVAFSALRLT